ncbi:EAL domain-containing protein [Glaciecola sp. 2405UD65-10]|uniref:two-component system response regulator n=1 Tax=Glaciecola sp. 2405UD65-10 TaxID=3397244 RepID=UPI003B59A523
MSEEMTSLLIVEDNPADMTLYLRLLEDVEHGFEHVECLSTIKSAKKSLIGKPPPTCCLLDYNLPDGSALSLLESLQSDKGFSACPIIIITGQEDTKSAVRLLKLGAQDYIVKDELTPTTLLRTIRNAVNQWKLNKQLEQMALYDSLTGLTNRGLFLEKLDQTFNESARYKHHFGLMVVDLDKFKSINDIYGHQAGDYVLQMVAKKLLGALRSSDVAGRLGGDEFAILLPETCEKSAHIVAKKLVATLSFDITWKNSIIPVSPSIGVAMYPSKAQSYKKLMREADMALYRAKHKGRCQYVAYNECGLDEEDESERLKDLIPKALQNGKLQIAFQAIVDVDNTDFYAVEALTRWQHEGRWVNPIEVINIVMELGLDMEFHSWLLTQSLLKLKTFQKDKPGLKLCLNLPANVCHNFNFTNLIEKACEQYNVDSHDVILEVTETHLMPQPEKARECLELLVNAGFNVAIDDFGTGFSSMEYIADLPCNILKIDKKFFLELEQNPRNYKIIDAISSLAHSLGMKVIAEGIETKSLSLAARDLKCDYLQGYHLGFPVIDCEDWQDFISRSNTNPNTDA